MSYHSDTDLPATSSPDLLVAAASLARGADALPFALVPQGYELKSLERLLEEPIRKRTNVQTRTVASFLACFSNFLETEARRPAFYTNGRASGLAVSIILNPLTWSDSALTLNLGVSTALRRWLNLESAGLQGQKAFAQFIEDNLADVVEPQGAKLLEVCRSFRATQTVRFASTVDLSNGDVGLEYIQETKAGTVDSKSRLQVPENIVLGVPLFEGEERIKLRARFRYEVSDGRLALGIKFPQLDAAFEAGVADILARLQKAMPRVVFMDGVQAPVSPIEFKSRNS